MIDLIKVVQKIVFKFFIICHPELRQKAVQLNILYIEFSFSSVFVHLVLHHLLGKFPFFFPFIILAYPLKYQSQHVVPSLHEEQSSKLISFTLVLLSFFVSSIPYSTYSVPHIFFFQFDHELDDIRSFKQTINNDDDVF